jgi:hypothetical protein
MAAPQKRGRLKNDDNKRSDGAIEVRQIIRALNKAYSGTLTAGTSPIVHSFYADFGYNAIKGWITNDGDGNAKGTMLVEFSRDGAVWGEPYTLFPGERIDLDALDVHSLRLTHVVLDINYRIWQA